MRTFIAVGFFTLLSFSSWSSTRDVICLNTAEAGFYGCESKDVKTYDDHLYCYKYSKSFQVLPYRTNCSENNDQVIELREKQADQFQDMIVRSEKGEFDKELSRKEFYLQKLLRKISKRKERLVNREDNPGRFRLSTYVFEEDHSLKWGDVSENCLDELESITRFLKLREQGYTTTRGSLYVALDPYSSDGFGPFRLKLRLKRDTMYFRENAYDFSWHEVYAEVRKRYPRVGGACNDVEMDSFQMLIYEDNGVDLVRYTWGNKKWFQMITLDAVISARSEHR